MRSSAPQLISWRLAALVAVGVGLLAVSPLVSALVLAACVIAALIGPSYALQAMMIATLVTYANPAIIKFTPEANVLSRLVLVAAALRVLPLLRAAHLRLLWPIWLFGAVSALTSYVTSPALSISIMKVITFTLAASVVVVAFGRLTAERLLRLQCWFLTVSLTVIGLCALTLLKPGLGIGGNGGLQGVLNQPQALGIFIAPFAAWCLAGVLLMRRQSSRLEFWIAVGSLVLIALTRARTAAFATAFGTSMVFVSRLVSRRRAQQASVGRPVLILTLSACALLVVAITTGQVSKFATSFAFKGTEREQHQLSGAFYESRGAGVSTQWHNFLASPWIGNGFGVYPDGKFPSGVTMFAGIPISAPIEKGFLPSAILEEGGLVGAATLALLIVWLGHSAWRAHDLRWRALFLACLGVNVGECVFLSPGGIGLITWLLMGTAVWAHRTEARSPTRAPPCDGGSLSASRVTLGPVSLPQAAP